MRDEITSVPEDTLDRLLMGRATEGDQLLAHNAILALRKPDHAEDKLGMVQEGWRCTVAKAADAIAYAAYNAFGCKLEDLDPGIVDSTAPFEVALIAERDLRAMLAADPAPDHSAGVGEMVASTMHIPRSESLDPIYCYFEDTKPGAGRITIACYGDAWTGAWNAMGDRTVRQFVAGCHPDYLACSMLELRTESKRIRDYTARIASAVIAALAQPADADGAR